MQKILASFLSALILNPVFAQERRLADHNTIGWFAYTGTFKVTQKLALHTEYQWRRTDAVKNWQQGLLRAGLNYSLNKQINLVAGYAFAQTYSYGDYPAAFTLPEHRIFEQVIIKNPIGQIGLSHRFTLEQRFAGRVTIPAGLKNINYSFLNRIRYRVRGEIPLHKKESAKKIWSFIAQDEIFIGWGKNTGANIFDQNRIGLLIGYKIHNKIKLEGGYINQTLQQARRVNNMAVYQDNNGFILATNFSLDFTGK